MNDFELMDKKIDRFLKSTRSVTTAVSATIVLSLVLTTAIGAGVAFVLFHFIQKIW